MRVERESPELLREANRYHQQYLFKNPNGYCCIGGTDVKLGDPSEWSCPTGLTAAEE
ncbi:hypothetical protein ACWGH8_28325 [Nonomuraea muscovyensis]|uniref:Peptide methionine sulfoxide reductase MsrA n=1 Tax=Nonomuraea muscovyensis TaxID=1124761 RepID=A0A7X0C1B7_9ACTN|nr:hypothetical protein [Nonomuraea muscovyensis]MBB6346692.1 peptide methionine sulfoxide reductase MsrA [Nonomuraea muscovyensis]